MSDKETVVAFGKFYLEVEAKKLLDKILEEYERITNSPATKREALEFCYEWIKNEM